MPRILAILDGPAGYVLAACAAIGLICTPMLVSALLGRGTVERNADALSRAAERTVAPADALPERPAGGPDPMEAPDDPTGRSRSTP